MFIYLFSSKLIRSSQLIRFNHFPFQHLSQPVRFFSAYMGDENQPEQVILGEDGKPLSKGALKKLEKQREKEKRKQEVAARLVDPTDLGCRKGCQRSC